jgi:hypothetical protein
VNKNNSWYAIIDTEVTNMVNLEEKDLQEVLSKINHCEKVIKIISNKLNNRVKGSKNYKEDYDKIIILKNKILNIKKDFIFKVIKKSGGIPDEKLFNKVFEGFFGKSAK